MTTLTKIYNANDPKISGDKWQDFFRRQFEVSAIEDLGPDSYFIYKLRKEYSYLNDHGLHLIVKHKDMAREIFAHYRDADEIITKVKEKAYGR